MKTAELDDATCQAIREAIVTAINHHEMEANYASTWARRLRSAPGDMEATVEHYESTAALEARQARQLYALLPYFEE